MNFALKKNNQIYITLLKNPFDPENSRVDMQQLSVGKTVNEIIADFDIEIAEIVLVVNGRLVKHNPLQYIPNDEDYILIAPVPHGGGGSKDMFRAIAMIAILVAAPQMVGVMAGVGWGAIGTTHALTAMGSMMAAGIAVGGAYLVNAIFPPVSPDISFGGDMNQSQNYGWDLKKNSTAEGGPIPVLQGTFRFAPPLISNHIEIHENKQYYNLLYLISRGVISGDPDVYINNLLHTEYHNVEIECVNGGVDQKVIPWFNSIYEDNLVNLTLDKTIGYNETLLGYENLPAQAYLGSKIILNHHNLFTYTRTYSLPADWSTVRNNVTWTSLGTTDSNCTDFEIKLFFPDGLYRITTITTTGRDDIEYTRTRTVAGTCVIAVEYVENGKTWSDSSVQSELLSYSRLKQNDFSHSFKIEDIDPKTYDIRIACAKSSKPAQLASLKTTTSDGGNVSTTTTIGTQVDSIKVGISCPGGLQHVGDNGTGEPYTIRVSAGIRPYGTTDGFTVKTISITGESTEALRKEIIFDRLDPDKYEIQVYYAEQPETGERYVTDAICEYIQEGISQKLNYPGCALLAVRALADDQLSGGLPRIECEATRETIFIPESGTTDIVMDDSICNDNTAFARIKTSGGITLTFTGSTGSYPLLITWDNIDTGNNGTIEKTLTVSSSPQELELTEIASEAGEILLTIEERGFSGTIILTKITGQDYKLGLLTNPAWACYEILRISKISDSLIAIDDFSDWADYCDTNGLTCSIYFDTGMTLRKALDYVSVSGHAIVTQKGSKWHVLIDQQDTPVQMFNAGNIVADSFKEVFEDTESKADCIEVTYFDKDKDYSRQTIGIRASDFNESEDDKKPAAVTLFACVDRELAIALGVRMLNSTRLGIRSAEWKADIDAIACKVNDVVYLQHPTPYWGDGGRVESATASTVTFDSEVTLSHDETYTVLVRHMDDTIEEQSVVSPESGETTSATITISGTWTTIPVENCLWWLGTEDEGPKKYKITKISTANDQIRTISAVEYHDEIYTSTSVLNSDTSETNVDPVINLTAKEIFIRNPDGTGELFAHLEWQGFAPEWRVWYFVSSEILYDSDEYALEDSDGELLSSTEGTDLLQKTFTTTTPYIDIPVLPGAKTFYVAGTGDTAGTKSVDIEIVGSDVQISAPSDGIIITQSDDPEVTIEPFSDGTVEDPDNPGSTMSGVGIDGARLLALSVGTLQVDNAAITNAKIADSIQSDNYVAGSTGWKIGLRDGDDGFAEFSNVTVRGTVHATAGDIGGWTLASNKISITGIELDQGNSRIRVGTGASDYVDITPSYVRGVSSSLGTTFDLPTDGSAPTFASGTIKEVTFEMYTSGIIKTDSDPATNGGLLINQTALRGYTSTGLKLIEMVYGGTNQGDVYFGDYDNSNAGLKYDHSAGTLNFRGSVTITGGSGIQNLSDAGDLATLNSIGTSNCDSTIIDGGYLKTSLIAADSITASHLNGSAFGTLTISSGKIQINTTDALEIAASGNMKIVGGADIILDGDNTMPGMIKFQGSNYDIKIAMNSGGDRFAIYPDTDKLTSLYFGQDWGGGVSHQYKTIASRAAEQISLYVYDTSNDYRGGKISITSWSTRGEIHMETTGSNKVRSVYFTTDTSGISYFWPSSSKGVDLGKSTQAWDDFYYDDLYNQCLFLDDLDDLSILHKMAPKGTVHPETNLPELSIQSLPKWMTNYDKLREEVRKENGDLISDEDFDKMILDDDEFGYRYYRNFGHFVDLTAGAIRQLDKKVEALITHIEALEKEKI